MNTPVATNPSKAIPLVVSSVEEIPLNRIRESTTNPRCQFDETKLRREDAQILACRKTVHEM